MSEVPLLPLFIAAALVSKMWCCVWFAAVLLMLSGGWEESGKRATVVAVRYIPLIVVAPVPLDALLVMVCLTHGMIILRLEATSRPPPTTGCP